MDKVQENSAFKWNEPVRKIHHNVAVKSVLCCEAVPVVLKRPGGRMGGTEGRWGPHRDAAACCPLISVGDSAGAWI